MSIKAKERPILFNATMVIAILNGSKTQSRRVIRKQPVPNHRGEFRFSSYTDDEGYSNIIYGTEGNHGDILCSITLYTGEKLKGKNYFAGSTNGGAVKPVAACDGTSGCADSDVAKGVEAAKLLGSS